LFIALKFINISEGILSIIDKVFIIAVTYEVIILSQQVVDYFIDKLSNRRDNSSKAAFNAVGKFFK